jgi:multiple sugar transport system permease protein
MADVSTPLARSAETLSERLGLGRDAATAWLLVAPAALAYAAMILVPTLALLVLAFTDYELGAPSLRWIGLKNFQDLFADATFRASVRNTALYVLFVVPASVGLGLLIALLIEAGSRGRALFRALFFLPVVSLTVAMATAWSYILHPTIGPLNAVLRALGLGAPNWLGDSGTVLVSLGFIGIWENAGFNLVLFLAGLTAIPRDLYAAAEIDGAKSAWDRFATVTWPLLGPTTLFVVVMTTVRSIRVFDTVATLTQGGPNKASEVILLTMYTEGFSFFRMGYSAAITLVFLAAVTVLMLIQNRLIDRRVHYG